ncbi:helicase associated domain-containing protein [Streptomyces sp. NPDC001948]
MGSRRPGGGCARRGTPYCGCRTRSSHWRAGVGWGGVGGYPFGRWIADQRRSYAAGTLEARRVTELEKLGMVWSDQVTAVSGGREQEFVQGPPHLVQGLLEFLRVVVA